MQVDVTDIAKEIVYNARLGLQNMKVIEVTEKLDDDRKEFLAMKFVNQWGEYHYEKVYPDKHGRKLFELASAINDGIHTDGGRTIVDAKQLIGGYFNATLEPAPMQNGDVTTTLYIRKIRAYPRRKDTTGSMGFKRPRKRK